MKCYRYRGEIPRKSFLKDLRRYIELWPKELRGDIRDWVVKEVSDMRLFPLERMSVNSIRGT